MGKSQSLNRQALVHTYEQYSPRLYCYAVRLLGDANLAEECVSETFCRYLHTLKAGRGPTISAQAYLYRIAHNWITDFFRQHPQTEPLADDVPADAQDDPAESTSQRFEREQVRKALRHLTADQQQVISLRFLDDFSTEEIAEIVGKTTEACKMLQYRALNALRGLLTRKQE